MAHERLGIDVLTDGVRYPPVFPLTLALLVAATDPILAVVAASLVARSVAVLSVYFVLRDAGRVTAAITAGVFGVAAFQLEAYAWGAYPQILGGGLAILATYYTIRFAKDLRRRDALIAVIGSVGVVFTHTLVTALLVVALPAAYVHAAWVARDVRLHWRQALLIIVPVPLLSALYLTANAVGDSQAILNPTALSLVEGVRLALGESPAAWLIITLVGLSSLFRRQWRDTTFLPVSVGFAWTLAGIVSFLITAERRCLLAAQVGILILAASAASRLLRRLERRRIASALLWIATISVIGSVLIPGIASYSRSTEFYRIVDSTEVESLEALGDAASRGDVVMASRGRNTIPIGWWAEGVARLPTLSGHDPRYLTFPAEIEEAEASDRFFQGDLDEGASLDYLKDLGVRFVLVDKRGPDSGWITRANVASYDFISDSATLLVLRVPEIR